MDAAASCIARERTFGDVFASLADLFPIWNEVCSDAYSKVWSPVCLFSDLLF